MVPHEAPLRLLVVIFNIAEDLLFLAGGFKL
jgi:hypothetical protein